MAILKYIYLSTGLPLFVLINYLSYTMPTFQGDLTTKIIYSSISFLLLMLDYMIIIKTHWLFKRSFQEFSTYMKVMLYLGIWIIPLISLYYQS